MNNLSPSGQLEHIIKKFPDWRGQKLALIRDLINQADPDVVQDVKWKTTSSPDGVPVWYHDGMICTAETYKKHIRISFAKGPQLDDPKGLINSYRAILIHEGDELDEAGFIELFRNAVKLNTELKIQPKSKAE